MGNMENSDILSTAPIEFEYKKAWGKIRLKQNIIYNFMSCGMPTWYKLTSNKCPDLYRVGTFGGRGCDIDVSPFVPYFTTTSRVVINRFEIGLED